MHKGRRYGGNEDGQEEKGRKRTREKMVIVCELAWWGTVCDGASTIKKVLNASQSATYASSQSASWKQTCILGGKC